MDKGNSMTREEREAVREIESEGKAGRNEEEEKSEV